MLCADQQLGMGDHKMVIQTIGNVEKAVRKMLVDSCADRLLDTGNRRPW